MLSTSGPIERQSGIAVDGQADHWPGGELARPRAGLMGRPAGGIQRARGELQVFPRPLPPGAGGPKCTGSKVPPKTPDGSDAGRDTEDVAVADIKAGKDDGGQQEHHGKGSSRRRENPPRRGRPGAPGRAPARPDNFSGPMSPRRKSAPVGQQATKLKKSDCPWAGGARRRGSGQTSRP